MICINMEHHEMKQTRLIELKSDFGFEQEVARVQDTVKRLPWFLEQGYPRDIIELPKGISEDSTEEDVTQVVKAEYDEKDYLACAKDFQEEWKTVSGGFEEMRKVPSFRIRDDYSIQHTRYGMRGSYNAENNRVIVRFDTRPMKELVGVAVHEIVHTAVQHLINKYHVSHWRKERLVDLLVDRYFPGLKKSRSMKENVSIVDEAYARSFPDMEAVARAIGDK
jgi:hypothetical protein